MKKITYIFPSRSRPVKFFAALDNIAQLSAQNNYEVIAVLDTDDLTMNNQSVKDKLMLYPNVKPFYRLSLSKVDAINRELWRISPDTDIVCCHSDDMIFIKPGFDLDIKEASRGFNGLIHFPDQIQKERLVTYSITTKDYLDIDGWIYNPRILSVYCDNFQMELAKKRGKYKFVNEKILEHRHPYWGYGTKDELLLKEETYSQDKATLDELKNEYQL